MVFSFKGKVQPRNKIRLQLAQNIALIFDNALSFWFYDELFVDQLHGIVVVIENALDQIDSREAAIAETLDKLKLLESNIHLPAIGHGHRLNVSLRQEQRSQLQLRLLEPPQVHILTR